MNVDLPSLPKSFKLFLTNDDGYRAPGLHALLKHYEKYCTVIALAPDRNRSACSSQLSTMNPLRIEKHSENLYSCNGTPADCVHVAHSDYFKISFDSVVSGINHGGNLGDDVFYSGTFAGALEGRFFPELSLAVSLCGEAMKNFSSAAKVSHVVLGTLLQHAAYKRSVFNVNVPDMAFDALSGISLTRLGNRQPPTRMVKTEDGRGQEICWIGQGGQPKYKNTNIDFAAVDQGLVSVTPISLDMTDHSQIDPIQKYFLN